MHELEVQKKGDEFLVLVLFLVFSFYRIRVIRVIRGKN
jgi:hypothetical protein